MHGRASGFAREEFLRKVIECIFKMMDLKLTGSLHL